MTSRNAVFHNGITVLSRPVENICPTRDGLGKLPWTIRSVGIEEPVCKAGQACPVNSAKFRVTLSIEMFEGKHGVLTVQVDQGILRSTIDRLHPVLVAKEDADQALCHIQTHIEEVAR